MYLHIAVIIRDTTPLVSFPSILNISELYSQVPGRYITIRNFIYRPDNLCNQTTTKRFDPGFVSRLAFTGERCFPSLICDSLTKDRILCLQMFKLTLFNIGVASFFKAQFIFLFYAISLRKFSIPDLFNNVLNQ